MDRRGEIPVCNGNPVVGRHREGAGDAGHHFKGNIVFRQKLQFLSAPPEQEGVAALEPHDSFPRLRLFQKCPVDLVLLHPMVAGALPDIDLYRIFRNQCQHLVSDQCVMDNDLRILQNFQSF